MLPSPPAIPTMPILLGIGSLILPITLGGCERADPPQPQAQTGTPSRWVPVDLERLDEAQAAQLQRAIEARDALAQALKADLMGAIRSGGPTHAVDFCHANASPIAEQVRATHGVEIGRTSHKLRNPSNTGPEWVQPVVEAGVAQPYAFAGEGGELGVAYPIMLENACVLCHGETDQIAPNTGEIIADRYPEDRATGFSPGDLRGWFWVQVPQEN